MISRAKINLIVALYCGCLPKTEIARRSGVSYNVVKYYTEGKGDFETFREYQDDWAKRNGYSSLYEYRQSLKRRNGDD